MLPSLITKAAERLDFDAVDQPRKLFEYQARYLFEFVPEKRPGSHQYNQNLWTGVVPDQRAARAFPPIHRSTAGLLRPENN